MCVSWVETDIGQHIWCSWAFLLFACTTGSMANSNLLHSLAFVNAFVYLVSHWFAIDVGLHLRQRPRLKHRSFHPKSHSTVGHHLEVSVHWQNGSIHKRFSYRLFFFIKECSSEAFSFCPSENGVVYVENECLLVSSEKLNFHLRRFLLTGCLQTTSSAWLH